MACSSRVAALTSDGCAIPHPAGFLHGAEAAVTAREATAAVSGVCGGSVAEYFLCFRALSPRFHQCRSCVCACGWVGAFPGTATGLHLRATRYWVACA